MTEIKHCKKHGIVVVTPENKGYCELCYPFPRVYCAGCGQPLTSERHRRRGMGARCWKKYMDARRHMKEDVEFVETGSKEYRTRKVADSLEDLF